MLFIYTPLKKTSAIFRIVNPTRVKVSSNTSVCTGIRICKVFVFAIKRQLNIFFGIFALIFMTACTSSSDPLQSVPRSSNQPDFMPGTSSTGIEVQVRFNNRNDAQQRIYNINRAADGDNFNREAYRRLRNFVAPAIVVDGVVRNGKMQLEVPNFQEAAKRGALAGRAAFIPIAPGEHRMEIWATDSYSGKRSRAYAGTHRFLEGTTISVAMVLTDKSHRIEVEGVPYDISSNPDLEERYNRLEGGVAAIKDPTGFCFNADYDAIRAKINNFEMTAASSDLSNIERACKTALASPASPHHVAYILSYSALTMTREILLSAQEASKGRRLSNLQSGLSVIKRYGAAYTSNDEYQAVVQAIQSTMRSL